MLIGNSLVLLRGNSVKVEFDGRQFEIQLSSFQSEGNEEYILLDTGCVLNLLRRFHTLLHKLKSGTLKLAILEKTIKEVAEHLSKSQSALIRKGNSSFYVRSAMENFRKLVQDDRIRKIVEPLASNEVLSRYEQFREDKLLALVLFEGRFKAVATQDNRLARRIGENRYIPCERLWID